MTIWSKKRNMFTATNNMLFLAQQCAHSLINGRMRQKQFVKETNFLMPLTIKLLERI